MMRGLPSMTTVVSSEWEIGLKYGYRPAAWISRARVKFLHLSNNAMFCRVSVPTGPRSRGGEKLGFSLAALQPNRKVSRAQSVSTRRRHRVT